MLYCFVSRFLANGLLIRPFTCAQSTQAFSCLYTSSSANFVASNISRSGLRNSSSDVFQHCDHIRIDDLAAAKKIASKIGPEERELLLQILVKQSPNYTDMRNGEEEESELKIEQVKQLFAINTIPFVGFGFLDNAIMILAGEYIDQSIGAMLCISTMAAAALGNIISDVAGVGLAHYVEGFVTQLGFKSPNLTTKQLESRKARLIVNLARAFGLTFGCLLGMFPLLFFDESPK